MTAAGPALARFGFDRPGVLALALLALTLAVGYRGKRGDRAFSRALMLLLLLHGLAWLRAGSVLALHAACDTLALALIGTLALRSRQSYPLVLSAALLLATIARLSGALGPQSIESGARMLATLADLALTTAFTIAAVPRLLRKTVPSARPREADRDCPEPQAGVWTDKQGRPQ